MQITAADLGKRFQRDWIFRGLTRTFRPGSATAVLGPNGAGKSTLLNTFSGQLLPTDGTLTYTAGRPARGRGRPATAPGLCGPLPGAAGRADAAGAAAVSYPLQAPAAGMSRSTS